MAIMFHVAEIAVLFGCIAVVTSQMVTLTSNVTSGGDGPHTSICSSETIKLTCVGTRLTFLTWRINSEIIMQYTINSGRSINDVTENDGIKTALTNFMRYPQSQIFANFMSTLTTEGSALMTGDVIECSGGSASDSITIHVIGPPPAPTGFETIINGSSEGTVTLTIIWDTSFTTDYSIDSYCVRGRERNCPQRCVDSSRPYHCSGLPPGRYEFRVQAVNCGNQGGVESETISIHPQVPASPNLCMSVPVYDQLTKQLQVIENTWHRVQNPPEIMTGRDQDVVHYFVTYHSQDNSHAITINVSNNTCTSEGVCAYNISDSFIGQSYYTVSVSAVNLVGEGDTCSQGIAATNDIVTVLINTVNTSSPTISCEFTSAALHSNASCSLCIGTGSPCQSSMCLPSVAAEPLPGTDGLIASVTLPDLKDGVRYQFGVTANISQNKGAIVIGSFSTACVSADLAVIVSTLSVGGVNKAFIDQRCSPNDTGSIRISHGVICYNGTTAGSVATHICDVGYQVPPGESDHRMCLVNGNWEGDVLICVEPQSGYLTAGGITSITILAISFLVMGVVNGGLVCYIIKENRKLKEISDSTSLEESRYVHQSPLPSSSPQTERRDTASESGSIKYATVLRSRGTGGSIDTRGNMAYQYGEVQQQQL